ncbi:MAG: hypothetical protein GX910_04665 [Clostridiaceae bacterium]|nr:hypothetical protein [Clostridiaceae bacterium]
MKSYREIYVSSPVPFDRGKQHGEQAKAEIANIISGYKDLFSKVSEYTWDDLLSIAKEYVSYLGGKADNELEEMRGIAEGAGVLLEEVVVLNTRYEFLRAPKADSECTSYGVLPEKSADGWTICGQNWDTNAFVGEDAYVLHIDECNGLRIVGVTEPGQLIRSGMNNYGISINANTILTKSDYRGLGMPTNVLRRQVLTKRNFAEVEELINSYEYAVSCNYMVGSKEGIIADFEVTPKEIFKITPKDGIIAHGNDCVVDPSVDRDYPPYEKYHRHFRGQRLQRILSEAGKVGTADIENCLKDHYHYPYSVCFHPDPDYPKKTVKTIMSCLYCLDPGYALICRGNPCEGEFHRYDC